MTEDKQKVNRLIDKHIFCRCNKLADLVYDKYCGDPDDFEFSNEFVLDKYYGRSDDFEFSNQFVDGTDGEEFQEILVWYMVSDDLADALRKEKQPVLTWLNGNHHFWGATQCGQSLEDMVLLQRIADNWY